MKTCMYTLDVKWHFSTLLEVVHFQISWSKEVGVERIKFLSHLTLESNVCLYLHDLHVYLGVDYEVAHTSASNHQLALHLIVVIMLTCIYLFFSQS